MKNNLRWFIFFIYFIVVIFGISIDMKRRNEQSFCNVEARLSFRQSVVYWFEVGGRGSEEMCQKIQNDYWSSDFVFFNDTQIPDGQNLYCIYNLMDGTVVKVFSNNYSMGTNFCKSVIY